jgi:hypothetical protein
MESEQNKPTQFDLLKERITYEEAVFGNIGIYNKCLNCLLEDSKYIALSIRFPFQDYYEIELPKKYNNWQLRCAEELYALIGKLNVKSYAENGISWTRDSGNISDSLKEEIIPCVGVIKNE